MLEMTLFLLFSLFMLYLCLAKATYSLTLNESGGLDMKPKKKMHFQEEYELDNYLNEDDDRYYEASSNATIWYS